MANIPLPYPEHTRFSFGSHATFPLRYGWLEKFAINRLTTTNKASINIDTKNMIKDFGLGSGMADSLSFWLKQCRLVEMENSKAYFSDFAKKYFGPKDGIDVYLENVETIWILHWFLTTSADKTSTWFWFFNYFEKKIFSRQDLVDDIFDQCTNDGPHKTTTATENGVRRDVDCFIRSYLGTTNPKAMSEDKLDSPFTELGLFKKGTGDTIQKVETERKNLPYGLLILSICGYWDKLGAFSNTLSFENLLSQPYSPGKLFGINREGLLSKCNQIEEKTIGLLSFDQSSGLSQVIIHDADQFKNKCQENYLNVLENGCLE